MIVYGLCVRPKFGYSNMVIISSRFGQLSRQKLCRIFLKWDEMLVESLGHNKLRLPSPDHPGMAYDSVALYVTDVYQDTITLDDDGPVAFAGAGVPVLWWYRPIFFGGHPSQLYLVSTAAGYR